MKEMICKTIDFFLLLTNFVLGCSGDGYTFTIETIELTRPTVVWINGKEAIDAHPFSRLSPERQSNLCARARAFASVDERSPRLGGMEMGVDMFAFCYADGTATDHIALLCPSIPLIYLRLSDLNLVKEVTIMERRNPYTDQRTFTFWPQLVRAVTRVRGFDEEIRASVNRALTEKAPSLESLGDLPYLVYRNNMERRDMCIAARRRAWPSSTIIVSDEWTNVAEEYEVIDVPVGQRKIVAFPCNSVPQIYVSVHDKSSNIIYGIVIFEQQLQQQLQLQQRHFVPTA